MPVKCLAFGEMPMLKTQESPPGKDLATLLPMHTFTLKKKKT